MELSPKATHSVRPAVLRGSRSGATVLRSFSPNGDPFSHRTCQPEVPAKHPVLLANLARLNVAVRSYVRPLGCLQILFKSPAIVTSTRAATCSRANVDGRPMRFQYDKAGYEERKSFLPETLVLMSGRRNLEVFPNFS